MEAQREQLASDFMVRLLFLGPRWETGRILVPQSGMEPRPPAVKAGNPNQWISREVPHNSFVAELRQKPQIHIRDSSSVSYLSL